jgi:hypothetical protein
MKNKTVTLSREFKRENRYIVLKRKDLEKVPAIYRNALIEPLSWLRTHLPHRECLVIESDWPEYEPTWAAIERRMTGTALAEPVPPAGVEVEVLAQFSTLTFNERRLYDDDQPDGYLEGDGDFCDNNMEAAVWFLENGIELRTQVTRLQAENKRLDLMVAQSDYNYDQDRAKWQMERDALQAELTKARELLRSWVIQNPTGRAEQLVSETKSLLLRTAPPETKCGRCGAETACGKMICEDCCYEPVAHQSAPAPIKGMIETIGGEYAVMIDPENRHFGWTFKRHPDGKWVSGRKATDAEMNAARAHAHITKQQ